MVYLVYVAVMAALVVADIATKQLVIDYFAEHGPRDFLFGLFRLRYVENTGAAFSSFSNSTAALSAVTVIVIVACLIYLFTHVGKNRFVDITFLLIIPGGAGNVIDRIAKGYVVDFIEPVFVNFAVFNFADCCITVGAFMLLGYEIYSCFGSRKVKNHDK